MWVDNMVELKTLLRSCLSIFTFICCFTVSIPAMSYEEPDYRIVQKTEVYEVRLYAKRTVAQVNYGQENGGFRVLFNYISGDNEGSTEVQMTIPVTQSKQIDMTAPVTQSKKDGQMVMRFFLPKQYSLKTAPKPTDKRVTIAELPEQYFGVIRFSGFASDSNFDKHRLELKAALDKDGLVTAGQPIKATYNSPFTVPFLRRNEAMYPLVWQ